ncbi:hypothetical protein M378DRAFT_19391 [Amanita muscaria Koide BX008]|uniref:Uncharacterized protein n=1 Tax=Amanita muscaria (strain Koide BX008) TaxID=946122 RepID=A0A0C2WBG5_AMAMK|nr:hypothetical protein M378DRAFT_19391 [Amanita muscaria Koide BX008]
MDDVVRVEWFKLHLRPPHLAPSQEFELEKLRSFPKNKTPVQVFGDLLRYLFKSTMKYIRDSELWSWKSVKRNVYFVLSHPNGWEGKQQSQMRNAAIAAGLVDKSLTLERISKNPNLLNKCDGILVVDCGGGMIDVSAYSQSTKGRLKEISPSECLFQGSVFVTHRAQEYLKQKLRNSKHGVTKCTFDDPNIPYFVKFGGLRDNDRKFDIRSGSIKIPGTQIAKFFEPALQNIIQVIERQRRKST